MVNNKGKHITTVRSEAERVIDHYLPVRRPLAVAMDVQQPQTLAGTPLGIATGRLSSCLKKNLNASRPSEHPPVRGKKMSKRLGGIIVG